MPEILVGYDGGASANAALAAAIDLARALGDRVVLVFGFRDPALGGESADMRDALTAMGRRRVEEGAGRARADGVEVEELVVEQDPAEALAELAEQRGARMIVVGTRGEGRVRGLLLGSTPYRLVHLAKVPVLVVPHAE